MHDITPLFVIVTPSYNLADYIDQTILSVLAQAGNFHIRYHIQDGGSGDETPAILDKWASWINEKKFPVFCRGVEFSYSIEKDGGMYEAINRGFERARRPSENCLMSWINADDLMPAGALSAIRSFLRATPHASFVGGRTTIMCEEGFLADLCPPQPRLRSDIAEGFYSGGKNGFIMQEGVFWKSDLWDKVGGLNESLRLAGDFDLWMRFAVHVEYHVIDTITGTHRKRQGQLSANHDSYLREVRKILGHANQSNPLEQRLFGHYQYEIRDKEWQVRERMPERLLERFSVGNIDQTITFAMDCYTRARRRKTPPWWLTRDGWRARGLRDQLLSVKKSLMILLVKRLAHETIANKAGK